MFNNIAKYASKLINIAIFDPGYSYTFSIFYEIHVNVSITSRQFLLDKLRFYQMNEFSPSNQNSSFLGEFKWLIKKIFKRKNID